ncbi:MAG: hypothetical protein HQL16_08185 [Candidatus Omnitrophica bacterium]|nr:hypothetical protein [Candidatus Omnitrophota bacterium]
MPWPPLSATTSKPVVEQSSAADPGHNSCCSSGAWTNKTCLDKETRVLYIRSRGQDMRGRQWTSFEKAPNL